MSIELLAAEKLLEMAFAGIVGNTATEAVKLLWRKIKERLSHNNSIKAVIFELEQNPTKEKLKLLEPFLQVEMHKNKLFAEEISNLAREIAKSTGDTITTGDIKAETGGVSAAKIDAPNAGRIGGSDNIFNLGKE